MKLRLIAAAVLCASLPSCETLKRITGTDQPPPTTTTTVERRPDGTEVTTTTTTPTAVAPAPDPFGDAISAVAGAVADNLKKGGQQ